MRRALPVVLGAAVVALSAMTATTGVQAGAAFPSAAPQVADQQNVHQVGRAGRRAVGAAAITLGILGAAAIIGSSRARAHEDRYDRYEEERACRTWLRQCEYGSRSSCYKFDKYC